MKTIDIQEAIALAKEKKSLEGLAINDLGQTQVKAVDALALADCGIVIPEQNILYRDEDVAYDPEFDDHEWTKLPAGTTLEDLIARNDEHRIDESSIAYDEDIDELVIGEEITGMSWEEKARRFSEGDIKSTSITIAVEVENEDVAVWANEHAGLLKNLLRGIVNELYRSTAALEE